MEALQCLFGRRVLGLHPSSASVFVRHELGLPSLQSRKDMLVLRWWGRLWSIADHPSRLAKIMMLYRWNQIKSGNGGMDSHSSLLQVRDTLVKYNMQEYWLNGVSVSLAQGNWCQLVNRTVQAAQRTIELEEISRLSSLHTYRTLIACKSSLGKPRMAAYLNDTYNREGTIIKCKLRCNGLPLYDVLGSRADPSWSDEQRACPVCATSSKETVQHFIAECSVYGTFRQDLLSRVGAAPGVQSDLIRRVVADPIQLMNIVLGANDYAWNSSTMAVVNKIANNYLMLIYRHRKAILMLRSRSMDDCL
jgi:hypothetical protein